MHLVRHSGIARHCAVVLTLAGAITATATSAGATTILFEQPIESGIAGHTYAAHVSKGGLPTGSFDLVIEQPDPFTNGYLVPTSWDAASQTGFVPTSPSIAQLGYRNQAGTSTAQMEGSIVGGYLNSRDLPTTLSGQKMMIAPQFRFPYGTEPVPFASSTGLLSGAVDLQVPVAVGSNTYVTSDFLFVGPNGVRLSYGIKLFHNGAAGQALVGSHYDSIDNVFIINCPLGTDTQFVTIASTSSTSIGTPWLGWRHFQWTVDRAQFLAALQRLHTQFPTKVQSTDPSQYVFSEVHLNAEFIYSPAPAELGWSMRGLKVWD